MKQIDFAVHHHAGTYRLWHRTDANREWLGRWNAVPSLDHLAADMRDLRDEYGKGQPVAITIDDMARHVGEPRVVADGLMSNATFREAFPIEE